MVLAIEVEELQRFVVLARSLSMSAAARDLHISQPTLSRSIQRLERHLGVELFFREGYRLRLNGSGSRFLPRAEALLLQLRDAETELRDMVDPERGLMKLGFLPSLGSWLVPDVLKNYRSQNPFVAVELHSGSENLIEERLNKADCDLILTAARPDLISPGIVSQRLRRERIYVALPRGHALAAQSSVRLGDLSSEEFVVASPESGFRRFVDHLCESAGFAPTVVFESAELATIRGLVAADLGVAIVPEYHGPSDIGGPVEVPIADRGAYRDVIVGWSDLRPLTPVASRFVGFLMGEADRWVAHEELR